VEKLRPNPPAPFPGREGGEIKAYLLVGERFFRYREKLDFFSIISSYYAENSYSQRCRINTQPYR
jgi:hypothetical protein